MILSEKVKPVLDFLGGRQRDYQLAFGSPAGKAVLSDLIVFCRGVETCAVPGDHDRTMMLLGRNEVWLRIQNHLKLTPEQLFVLFNAKANPNG